jgi:hypothetical protein
MKADFTFIGINADGEVRSMSLDDAGCEQSNRDLIWEWLRMGRSVERIRVSALDARLRPLTSTDR